jgi:hypothetical protein
MNSAQEQQAPVFGAPAVLDASISSPIAWHRAQKLLREIDDHLRLVPGNAQDGEVPLRHLVEQMSATLQALRQAHEEQIGRGAARTDGLLEANAVLKKQIAEIAQAKRRLAAEHAVARILAESTRLADAAPKILECISRNLGWDVGALWTVDPEAEVLRCIEVWHAPKADTRAFEQDCRQRNFSSGIGLPGRVWASGMPAWIPDLPQDAHYLRAPIAAREGLHAAVAFPIPGGIEFLGVMEFFSLEIRQPDEKLLQMMISIGSHISQFIERTKAEKALFWKEAELSVAKKIQQGLVAKAPLALGDFEIAGASHCAAETGGEGSFVLLPGRTWR